jgi:predicted TIM-barrel fold metal-dependent hydrolase
MSMIIDSDTHLTEPPDLWTSRLPSAWGDQVMHVRWDEKRRADVWVVGDDAVGAAWAPLTYGLGRIADSDQDRPRTQADVHPATWDQAERVKVMDACGIRTAVLYPNFGGLNASRFIGMRSTEMALAHVRAYNDFQVEWCANFPGRFVPMLVVPFWDVAEAVAEIERTANMGFGGIVTTGSPQSHGEPFLADPHWNIMWQACVDAGLSVSFHIGSGNTGMMTSTPLIGQKKVAQNRKRIEELTPVGTNLAYSAVPIMLENGKVTLDLLLSGILIRFPNLKFVSVESGLGWVPFVLEAADYHFEKSRRWLPNHPWGDLRPSDLFHRQVYVNYWYEHLQPWHVEAVGEDNILFETDFPHRTCLEESEVKEVVDRLSAELPPRVCEKILWGNAVALYNLPSDVTS